jgi:hypothetical protein
MTDTSIAPARNERRAILRRVEDRPVRAHVIVREWTARRVFVYPNGQHLPERLQAEVAAAIRDGHALVDDDMRVRLTPAGDGLLKGGRR